MSKESHGEIIYIYILITGVLCKESKHRQSTILRHTETKQSSPSTRHGGAWGDRKYSSYSFFTSALDGGELSAPRPDSALPR
jgi:hypothetical protein